MLAQVKTAVANRLPLPIPEGHDATALEELVGEIQEIYRSYGFPLAPPQADEVADRQREIDRRAGRLYGL